MFTLHHVTKFMVIALCLFTRYSWGNDQASNKQVEEIRTAVERLFGSGYKVKSVKKTDLEHIFEVKRMNLFTSIEK